MSCKGTPRESLAVLSPNGIYTVRLIEMPGFDRNFDVALDSQHSVSAAPVQSVIYRSPDEGRPPGSETIIWSADSNAFVILGHKFYADEAKVRSDGLSIYLLYRISDGKLWCNAIGRPDLPRFDSEDVKKLGITLPAT